MLERTPTHDELRDARGTYCPGGRNCTECAVLHRHGLVAGHRFLCSDCYLVFWEAVR